MVVNGFCVLEPGHDGPHLFDFTLCAEVAAPSDPTPDTPHPPVAMGPRMVKDTGEEVG